MQPDLTQSRTELSPLFPQNSSQITQEGVSANNGHLSQAVAVVEVTEKQQHVETALAVALPPQGIYSPDDLERYESTSGKIPVERIGSQWFVTLPPERSLPLLYLCWSKVMDLTFGLLGLIVLLLLLPVLAVLIYLDSPGPIFYSQERLGYQGRKFSILKFRSMHPDAEVAGQAVWAADGDTRVTRIGRFLRATHLDELPQVLNILRGDMSLIGPRPERQEFITQLEKIIPFYRSRLSVKPGLTGWAQVKHHYTSTELEALAKLQYDLYYIKHRSFALDALIILRTVGEVALCRGR